MFKRRLFNGRKTSLPSFALVLVCLFSFSLLLGCTGSDTFIIQNTKLQKLFDANIVGSQGLIPFINFDGNALEVQSGFDFNSDTNTLRTGCIELGDGNYYCASTDFPNPDLSGYVPYQGATNDLNMIDNNIIGKRFGVNNDDPLYPFHVVLDANDTKAFYINGDTYPASANNPSGYLVDITRTRNNVDYGSVEFPTSPSDLALSNIITVSGTTSSSFAGTLGVWGKTTSGMQNQVQSSLNPTQQTKFGGTEAMYGMFNTLSKSGTFQPTDDFVIGSNLRLYGLYNTINNAVTVGDKKVTIDEYGVYNVISGTTTIGASPALIRREIATYNLANGAVTNPTAAGVTIERTGGYFATAQQGGINKGIEARVENQLSTNYAFYAYSANGTNNWAFYNASPTSGHNFLGNDNMVTYVGTGVDAGFSYNGTDFLVNPRYVGSGITKLQYGARVAGATLGTEKLTNGTFTGNANYWVLGTGFRYNTNLVRKDLAGVGTLVQTDANMASSLVKGEWMTLTFTISSRTAGGVTPSCGGFTGTKRSANGTYTETFRVTDPTLPLTFTPDATTSRFYIDTISLKAMTDGDLEVDGDLNVYKTTNLLGNVTAENDLNVLKNLYVDGNAFFGDAIVAQGNQFGLTRNNRIVKDVNVDGTFYCDMNYVTGILVGSDC